MAVDVREAKMVAWAERAVVPVRPENAALEFERIYTTRGRVTPEDVVEASSDEEATLHQCFEWDDAAAAKAHRLDQARYVMRSLVVVERKPDGTVLPPVRYLVKLTGGGSEDASSAPSASVQAATEPHVYIPIRVVAAEPDLRAIMVRDAWHAYQVFRRRAAGIEQFAAIIDAADKVGADLGLAS